MTKLRDSVSYLWEGVVRSQKRNDMGYTDHTSLTMFSVIFLLVVSSFPLSDDLRRLYQQPSSRRSRIVYNLYDADDLIDNMVKRARLPQFVFSFLLRYSLFSI